MANQKIPMGYQGSFLDGADGKPVMVMAARTVEINENSKGIIPKGAKSTMADKNKGGGGKKEFKRTFRKYAEMTTDQKECFLQGRITSDNNIKERLGLKKPRDK